MPITPGLANAQLLLAGRPLLAGAVELHTNSRGVQSLCAEEQRLRGGQTLRPEAAVRVPKLIVHVLSVCVW